MHTGRPLNEVKADLFKGLAHPLRIRVLELLAAAESLTVAELIDATGLEPSHLSQHLRVLRGYGLVVSERSARSVSYRLAHPSVEGLLAAARTLLGDVLEAHEALAQEHRSPVEGASR